MQESKRQDVPRELILREMRTKPDDSRTIRREIVPREPTDLEGGRQPTRRREKWLLA